MSEPTVSSSSRTKPNSASTESKPRTIRYVLSDKTTAFSQDLIEYLEQDGFSLTLRQRISASIEAFYLPLAVSPDHSNYKSIVVESLTKLRGQIDLIEAMTGIALPLKAQLGHSYHAMAHTQTASVATVALDSTQAKDSQVSAEPLTILKLEELEPKINELLQELANGGDGAKILQILSEIEPKNEEDWSERMWEIYDRAVHQVSEANYQSTFNPTN